MFVVDFDLVNEKNFSIFQRNSTGVKPWVTLPAKGRQPKPDAANFHRHTPVEVYCWSQR
jgi:hypothetical protein